MEETEQVVFAGPLALPIVRHETGSFYADLRLSEFRPVDGPLVPIDFDSKLGRRICQRNGIIKCPCCGTSVIIGRPDNMEKLRCVRCMNLLLPLFEV